MAKFGMTLAEFEAGLEQGAWDDARLRVRWWQPRTRGDRVTVESRPVAGPAFQATGRYLVVRHPLIKATPSGPKLSGFIWVGVAVLLGCAAVVITAIAESVTADWIPISARLVGCVAMFRVRRDVLMYRQLEVKVLGQVNGKNVVVWTPSLRFAEPAGKASR